MCSMRFARPAACMLNISLHLSSSSSPQGMNGCGVNILFSSVGQAVCWSINVVGHGCEAYSLRESANVLLAMRSWRIFSISISDTMICPSIEKRLLSSSIAPFSAMNALPANTASPDDSPYPQLLYTYPLLQRALCERISCLMYLRPPAVSQSEAGHSIMSAPCSDSAVLCGAGESSSLPNSMANV